MISSSFRNCCSDAPAASRGSTCACAASKAGGEGGRKKTAAGQKWPLSDVSHVTQKLSLIIQKCTYAIVKTYTEEFIVNTIIELERLIINIIIIIIIQ